MIMVEEIQTDRIQHEQTTHVDQVLLELIQLLAQEQFKADLLRVNHGLQTRAQDLEQSARKTTQERFKVDHVLQVNQE